MIRGNDTQRKQQSLLDDAEVRAHLDKLRADYELAHSNRRLTVYPPPRTRSHKIQQRRLPKSITTIRLSQDVLAAFRATGKGWQSRMNEALSEFVAEGRVLPPNQE